MEKISDITPYIYDSGTPIRDVLQRFDSAMMQVGCVVGDQQRLIGTVTDGDIRRGMLRGVGLNDTVDLCMNPKPYVLTEGGEFLPESLRYEFLPIVDAEQRLIDLFVAKIPVLRQGTCLVMAGGFGSRMGDLTRSIPKPLLPLDDQPILHHVLRRLEDTGYRQIFVSTYHLSEQVEAFIDSRNNLADIQVLKEEFKLGTAGAISLIPKWTDEPLIVLNGDVVTKIDLRAFTEFHNSNQLHATIAVARYEHDVPYGVVRQNDDGLFAGIEEKPKLRYFVSGGIYCFGREILSLVPKNVPMDMPELLNEARELGMKVGLFPIHEYWKDVGRPSDLSRVQADHEALDRK
ncbi:MAG: sugar phosphate nucleotidyltransferase [Alphaproteobacteria bacterium]|nr:sugar phosphate nucleotidyltransferase [Alphaproteobacteria bacterium]